MPAARPAFRVLPGTLLALGLALLLFGSPPPAGAEDAPDESAEAPTAWPREFADAGARLVMHQPQVDRWADDTLQARVAVELWMADADEAIYGALWVTGATRTNLDTRRVTVADVRVQEARFPSTGAYAQADVLAALNRLLPKGPTDIALDRLLANVQRTRSLARAQPAEQGPLTPRILVSRVPARLVLIDGDPVLHPIPGTALLHVVNTPWHVLLESTSGLYYLKLGVGWVSSPDLLAGPWQAAARPPRELANVPADHARAEARGTPAARGAIPAVYVRTEAAELIVLDGAPRYTAIPGTALLYVTNTQSDLFLHTRESRHYVLLGGRWFAAPSLDGPWQMLAGELPADFAAIPDGHPRADVLVSVPGTPEAEEAVLMAEIPRRAVIERERATVTVVYAGAPRFRPIPGIGVSYCVNTTYDVLLVSGRYYCCYQGVWFTAAAALGPWLVCDTVPLVIYDIPATCPLYHVTYVRVYEATPALVVFGYLPGYLGFYVCPRRRVVVFGTGWWYRPYVYGGFYVGWPLTFGLGVSWFGYVGGFVLGVQYYTPLAYRPPRATWYPYTPTYYTSYHMANAYARWGPQVIHRHAEWQRRSHVIGARGALDGFAGFGDRSTTRRTRPTPSAPARDLYVGRDGNVYRRSPDGRWERRDGSTWRRAPQPSAPRSTTPRTTAPRTTPPRVTPPRTSPPRSVRPPTRGGTSRFGLGLERDARSRRVGSDRVQRYTDWRRSAPSRSNPFTSRSRSTSPSRSTTPSRGTSPSRSTPSRPSSGGGGRRR